MKDFIYVSFARIPPERAHGYQIMKMCESFALVFPRVSLCVPCKKHTLPEDPFEYYRIKKIFTINKRWSTDLLGSTLHFGRIFYWIDTISFFFPLVWMGYKKKASIIYTRDLSIFAFSKKHTRVLEIHDILRPAFLFRAALHRADVIVVLNQYLKKEVMKQGISQEKIIIAPDGVDLNDFQDMPTKESARAELSLLGHEKIVTYTGHLYGWKGAESVAEAARLLPEIYFLIVGGVDTEFARFQAEYRSIENLRIVPFQKRERLKWYWSASDVQVLPTSGKSLIAREYTSPLKLFEYMATKRPIVASDLPSLREILNEKNAVLVEADNPNAFAKAISILCKDPLLAESLSVQALQDVGRYTWQTRAQKISDILLGK